MSPSTNQSGSKSCHKLKEDICNFTHLYTDVTTNTVKSDAHHKCTKTYICDRKFLEMYYRKSRIHNYIIALLAGYETSICATTVLGKSRQNEVLQEMREIQKRFPAMLKVISRNGNWYIEVV